MAARARIAVGGFQHETNTFAPRKATLERFRRGGSWPGMVRGAGLPDAVAGINLPIAGFLETAAELGFEPLPLTWANASPCAEVTEEAFETIVGGLLEDLAGFEALDGVYLDLHGAMVAEHLQDGEGEVLRRVRRVIGAGTPLVASLDLHANASPEMVAEADALIAYRTYPHVDMAETGARAARHLARLLAGEPWAAKAFRQIPFLMPITAGCTLIEPARGAYRKMEALEAESGALLSLNCGFPPADTWHCGPSVLGYGAEAGVVEAAVAALADWIEAREADFEPEVWQPEAAVAHAMARARAASWPIVLADTQDNPGAGGEGDTVGLLAELVRQGAEGAALAILIDAPAAQAAHAAGPGASLRIGLGARSGMPGHAPFEAEWRVEALADGPVVGTGPFYLGARMSPGPMALLATGGVRVLVGSNKMQAADQAIFRHLGLEPAEQKILGLKSSVHFRADFEPIAEQVLVVAAPGPNPVDHLTLPFRRLRPGLRLAPLGPAFEAAEALS